MNRYALRVLTQPPYEPFSLEDARDFLRIDEDETDKDALLNALIRASREWFEAYTGLVLIATEFEWSFDGWPCSVLELPRSPVLSVGEISYVDSNGARQTWAAANYQVDTSSEPARVALAYAGTFPSSFRADFNAWRVTFTAGSQVLGSPPDEQDYRENVPELAKLAMKTYITGAFEGTLDSMVKTAQLIAAPLRTAIL